MKRLMLGALALVTVFPSVAVAQGQCAPMPLEQALANVAQRHGEAPLFVGKMSGGETFVVTAKQDGDRSWTVIVVPAEGVVCIPAAGTDFQPMRNAKPTGSPS